MDVIDADQRHNPASDPDLWELRHEAERLERLFCKIDRMYAAGQCSREAFLLAEKNEDEAWARYEAARREMEE